MQEVACSLWRAMPVRYRGAGGSGSWAWVGTMQRLTFAAAFLREEQERLCLLLSLLVDHTIRFVPEGMLPAQARKPACGSQ